MMSWGRPRRPAKLAALLLIIARLSEALDTLPLHEVSPDVEELLRDFFEQKWLEGKLTEMWADEDIRDVVAVLASYWGSSRL